MDTNKLVEQNEMTLQESCTNFAPIVVFVYKRLEHTVKTISALKRNLYAEESILYVFSDAARSEDDVAAVNEVRKYIHSITGFKEVIVIERERNYGLAENIISGVTEIVNKHGKIIVLEEDIVTSKYFLKYMNDALTLYQDKDEVIEISGYMYPIMNKENLPETWFLYRFTDCWGWATWKNRWELFEKDPQRLIKEFTEDDIYHFNFEGSINLWDQVIRNNDGRLNSWAIFWQAVAYQRKKYVLVPTKSLVVNIGFDGSGENCGNDNDYNTDLKEKEVTQFPKEIIDNTIGREQMVNFFKAL